MTVGRMDHKAGHKYLEEEHGYTKDEAHVVLGGDEAKAAKTTYDTADIGQRRRDTRHEVEQADKDDEHNADGEGSNTGDNGGDSPPLSDALADTGGGGGDGGGDKPDENNGGGAHAGHAGH